MLRALIFDVDGTLADTEAALYTELLHVSCGKERIAHYWKAAHPGLRELGGMALQEWINRLHELKTAAYENTNNGGGDLAQLRAWHATSLTPIAARELPCH